MKYLLYIGILLAATLIPDDGTDVGKLIPVEVVAISENTEGIEVNTDTGDKGTGKTLDEAIRDMKAGASGIIYLDTAEYLLLEEGMEDHLNTVERHLKQGIRVCYARGGIELAAAANFLSVHKPDVTLRTVSDFRLIPIITEENGRYHLIEKYSPKT